MKTVAARLLTKKVKWTRRTPSLGREASGKANEQKKTRTASVAQRLQYENHDIFVPRQWMDAFLCHWKHFVLRLVLCHNFVWVDELTRVWHLDDDVRSTVDVLHSDAFYFYVRAC